MTFENFLANFAATFFRVSGLILELFATFFYRELFKRNTLRPLIKIIETDKAELQRRLLRQWARRKARESTYIQVAASFLDSRMLGLA